MFQLLLKQKQFDSIKQGLILVLYGAAKQVREAENAAKAKFIGERVPWDEDKHGPWETFAQNTLWTANSCKYEQNLELREQLLATAPKLLVEASPKDKRWGAGLAKSSPLICYPKKVSRPQSFWTSSNRTSRQYDAKVDEEASS